MTGKIFVVSGPSGSGKTSILKILFRQKRIKDSLLKIPTYTTRPSRKGERQGTDYYFLSRDEFLRLKKKRFFLESKQFLRDLYGSPRAAVEEALKEGRSPLLCVDVQGAAKLKNRFKNKAVLIFISPPSHQDLAKRLRKRKSEEEEDLKKRLRIAEKEVKYAKKYDYTIVNDRLKDTVGALKRIVIKELSS